MVGKQKGGTHSLLKFKLQMIELEAGHKEGKNKCRFCTIALYKSEFDFSENSTKNIYKGEQ